MAKPKKFKDLKKKTRKEALRSKKKRSKPCKSTSSPSSRPQQGNPSTDVGPGDTKTEKISMEPNSKNLTDYDDDFEHSKKVHLETCKGHMPRWIRSFEKRKFKTTDISDFEALLGSGLVYADHMPACDLKLRHKMGAFLIDEMEMLFDLWADNPDLDFQWITFVADKHMFNEREGPAENYKCKKAVQDVLRDNTEYNAIGIIETQAIINYPEGQKGKMFSVHAHVLCWGPKGQTAGLKRHSKRFKSSITKLPIHSSKVVHLEGSFGRIGRYMAKPPYEGKEVNHDKLQAGQACLSPARRMEKHHDLRLLELNAKTPMESLLFGVRGGVGTRKRVVKRMVDWQKARKGEEVEIGHRIGALFEDFLKDNNKRLKNYKPLKVKFRKDQ